MKRVTQMRLYQLGNLTRLRELRAEHPIASIKACLVTGEIYLRGFLDSVDNQLTLPTAVDKGRRLLGIIRLLGREDEPSQDQFNSLEFELSVFETSLEDDLRRLPTYLVEQVGAYSTDRLITEADAVFPLQFRDGAIIPPQSIEDFRHAGACLAFDLGTACGFHVFRATDAMLRKYCDAFGAELENNQRDWGSYIRALRNILKNAERKRKPNVRTVELLDSIRAVDRNPLIHPDQNLDAQTALATFDMCKNAVLFMALDIKNDRDVYGSRPLS